MKERTKKIFSEDYPIIREEDIYHFPWIEIDPRKNLHFPGVYLLVDKESDVVEYVGKSNKIGWRLIHGRHSVYKEDKHAVFVIYIEQIKRRDFFESQLIHLINPIYNKIRGHCPEEALTSERLQDACSLIDIPYYCETAEERIKEAQMQLRLEI